MFSHSGEIYGSCSVANRHNDSVSAIAFRTVDDVELLKTALEELIELGLNPRETGPRGLHVKMQTGKRILVPVHEIVSVEKLPSRKAPRRKKRR